MESDRTLPPPPPVPPCDASPAYHRIFEELSQFVSPELARMVLDEGLSRLAVTPATAVSYDFRTLLVDVIPNQIGVFMTNEDRDAVIAVLEDVLVDMALPRSTTESWQG
jgi:hypothetical protein